MAPPPLSVPSLLWGGGRVGGDGVHDDNDDNNDIIVDYDGGGRNKRSLFKVPFHSFGSTTAKRRFLRIKPYIAIMNNDNDYDDDVQSSLPTSSSWIEIALDGNRWVKAANPLAFVWDEPKSIPTLSLVSSQNEAASSTLMSSLLSSPLFKRMVMTNNADTANSAGAVAGDRDQHELLVEDITGIMVGPNTAAFHAYIAKNGTWSIPQNEDCCFSLLSNRRTIDLFVRGVDGDENEDVKVATAWKEALRILLVNYDNHRRELQRVELEQRQRQFASPHISRSMPIMTRTNDLVALWDPTLHASKLFEAVRCHDLDTLRYYLDTLRCPIDYMDPTTGDTILLLACRLGLSDVVRLALLGYHAKNDPHPTYGQTALQVAVSAGHVNVCKLILETAAPSNANRIIVNHEDENGEAPIHVAARCGLNEIMKLLVDHGANLDLIDGHGRTCIHLAAQSGHKECLAFALDSDAQDYLEVLSDDGFTPLHVAVRANKADCVQLLLERGANVSSETTSGSNVYNLAYKHRSERIMRLLLDYDVSDGESHDDEEDDDALSPPSTNRRFASPPGTLVSPVRSPVTRQTLGRSPSGTLVSPFVQSSNSTFPGSLVSPMKYGPRLSTTTSLRAAFATGGNDTSQTLTQITQSTIPTRPKEQSSCFEAGEFNYGGDLWMIYITENGYPYFFNTTTNTSSWDDPRLQVSALSIHTLQPRSIQSDRPATTSVRKKLTAIPQPIRKPTPTATQMPPSLYSTKRDTAMDAPPTTLIKTEVVDDENLCMAQLNSRREVGNTPRLIMSITGPTLRDRVKEDYVEGSDQTTTKLVAQLQSQASSTTPLTATPPVDEHLTKISEQAKVENDDAESVLLVEVTSSPISASSNYHVVEPLAPQPPTTIVAVPLQVTPVVLEKGEEINQRNTLLSMIKSRIPVTVAVSCDGASDISRDSPSQENAEDIDPKSLLLAQIKSRTKVANTVACDDEKEDEIRTGSGSGQSVKTQEDTDAASAIAKYMKMKAVGIPVDAILHKMTQDGVQATTIDNFRQRLDDTGTNMKPTESITESNVHKTTNLSKEDLAKDATLSKYVKMSAVGVPLPAVVAKMMQDGIVNEKINLFMANFGLEVATSAMAATRKPSSTHREERRASKALQKIHWTTVAEERLENSLWASDNGREVIKESDIAKLESLFGIASPKPKTLVKPVVAKIQETSCLIDPKRANNIAIALAQFRAFVNYDDLVMAVASLNQEHLNVENLTNMQLLLPTQEEMDTLRHLNGQSDGLGRAELFFLSVMKVPRFSQKLAAMRYSLQFDELARSLSSSLQVLAKACTEVIENEKLSFLLRRLLAIGNIMNESSGKPIAKGITLESLIKTATKRGSDDKTTVLDLLVQTAINGDDNTMTSATKGSTAVDFWMEMPAVRDAMRLDLEDCRMTMREIQNGLTSVELSIQTEQSQLLQDNVVPSSTSGNYLTKLVPFASHATCELQTIKSLFSTAENNVRSLCSFFAEDCQSCKATTIFSVLFDFSRLVEKSKEYLSRKKINGGMKKGRRSSIS